MKAGRELDKYVAEYVMNWNGPFEKDMPHYSTNIADAWTVVEKIKETGYEVEIKDGFKAECSIYSQSTGRVVTIMRAETVPLVICMAALDLMVVENHETA